MIGPYRGLKADYEKLTVTDEDVDRQVERLRSQTPKVEAVSRPARNGDELLLDFAGFADGVQFPGGTAEAQTLTLGSGAFIPGFEEQLVGAQAGDLPVVRVTFPADYPEMGGKQAEFRCIIREVREKSLYPLDDSLAEAVGHAGSYEELRRSVAESMQFYYDERAEQELRDNLIRQVTAPMDDVPAGPELDEALDQQMQALQMQLSQRGLDLRSYCSFTNRTEQQLREDALPEAKQSLLEWHAVQEIAAAEGLTPDEKAVADTYDDICRENHITLEELRRQAGDALRPAIERSVLTGMVLDLIRNSAEVRVVEAKR